MFSLIYSSETFDLLSNLMGTLFCNGFVYSPIYWSFIIKEFKKF